MCSACGFDKSVGCGEVTRLMQRCASNRTSKNKSVRGSTVRDKAVVGTYSYHRNVEQ